MGGRGTFAAGNPVPYRYETVGKIGNVRVIQGINSDSKGLPAEAHSSNAYIQLHPDGKFKMYREYDKDHYLVKEIAYHPEPQLAGNHYPVLHIHEYKRDNFTKRKPLPEKALDEAGKETVRMDKVNTALAMFDMEAVPGRKDDE